MKVEVGRLILLIVSRMITLIVLMTVPIVWPLSWTTFVLIASIASATIGLLLHLLILLIVSSLPKLWHCLEAASLDSSARGIDSMIVSVTSKVLSTPVLPSSELVDRILRGIDIENPLHYPDRFFTLEYAAIGMIDGEVFDLSSGKGGSLEQADEVPLVLGMLEMHEEAPA